MILKTENLITDNEYNIIRADNTPAMIRDKRFNYNNNIYDYVNYLGKKYLKIVGNSTNMLDFIFYPFISYSVSFQKTPPFIDKEVSFDAFANSNIQLKFSHISDKIFDISTLPQNYKANFTEIASQKEKTPSLQIYDGSAPLYLRNLKYIYSKNINSMLEIKQQNILQNTKINQNYKTHNYSLKHKSFLNLILNFITCDEDEADAINNLSYIAMSYKKLLYLYEDIEDKNSWGLSSWGLSSWGTVTDNKLKYSFFVNSISQNKVNKLFYIKMDVLLL